MMNTKPPRTPSLRRHKASSRAYIELNRRRFFLGPWGSPESVQAYNRILAEWLANGRRLVVPQDNLTVVELIAAYWPEAEQHYRDAEGNLTSSITAVREAARRLKALYGDTKVCEFGPKALRTVRHYWIKKDHARSTINNYTARVKRIFKWGVSHELVDERIYAALATVEGLQAGREGAPKRPRL